MPVSTVSSPIKNLGSSSFSIFLTIAPLVPIYTRESRLFAEAYTGVTSMIIGLFLFSFVKRTSFHTHPGVLPKESSDEAFIL